MLAGLRWGESVALERNDIEWDRNTIHVQRTWSEKSGCITPLKDSEARRVPMVPQLRLALQLHLERLGKSGYTGALVLPNTAGRMIASSGRFYSLFWKPLLALAGVAYRNYHCTRHRFATWALESGEEPLKVKNYLGHASLDLTLRVYYHALVGGTRGELGGMMSMMRSAATMAPAIPAQAGVDDD
jgi:integrase